MEKIAPSHTALEHNYHSKEVVSSACSEIFENILKRTYEEENPFRGCPDASITDNTSSEEGANASVILSDFAIIPRASVSGRNDNEFQAELEMDVHKTAKSKYTNATSTVTQVHFLNQKVSNPFEKLLTANESFTYHKPYYSRLSQNTIIEEEEETEEDYEELDALSASAEKVDAVINSRGVQKNANSGTSDFIAGNFEHEATMPNNLAMNSQIPHNNNYNNNRDNGSMQGQGDNNVVNNENQFVHVTDCTSISVKVNFAFYAKLLAFLLTINTLMFFKTFILSNVLNFWIR